MGYGTVTVGSSTAILVLAQNTNRKSVIITNEGDYKIYLGDDSSVDSTTGISIESGGKFAEDSGGTRVYLGDYYAIQDRGIRWQN